MLALVALCAAAISCQKLVNEEKERLGDLRVEPLKARDAIPAEYGKLVGVTNDNRYPYVSTLWFEKADGTIVAIGVDGKHNRLSDIALLIPRR